MAAFARWALVCIVSSSACGGATAFVCHDDMQCTGRDGGVCEPDGFCSFPDGTCPSGRRYGQHAGDGLSGTCVAPLGETSVAATDPTAISDDDGSPSSATMPDPISSSDGTTQSVDDSDPPGSTSDGDPTDAEDDATTGSPIAGLVAWYTFDDADDPYRDASGNDLHAWCDGSQCPEWQAGHVGAGAFLFDGVDDHLHIDHDPLLETTDAFSVSLWAQIDAIPRAWITVFSKPIGSATANSWEVAMYGQQTLWFGGGDTMTQQGLGTPWPSLGTWHHIAGTWDGALVRLYIDGSAAGSVALGTVAFDGRPMLIGADIDDDADDNFFPGALDDVRLYDYALTEAEIGRLASTR